MDEKVEKIKIKKSELDDIYEIEEDDVKVVEKEEEIDGENMTYDQTITYYEKAHKDDEL